MQDNKALQRRQFSREFKLMAVGLMESAENVQALADELGVERERLYRWRTKFLEGGADGLRRSGRPRHSRAAVPASPDQKMAELERKVGEQAALIEFLRSALQRLGGDAPRQDMQTV